MSPRYGYDGAGYDGAGYSYSAMSPRSRSRYSYSAMSPRSRSRYGYDGRDLSRPIVDGTYTGMGYGSRYGYTSTDGNGAGYSSQYDGYSGYDGRYSPRYSHGRRYY